MAASAGPALKRLHREFGDRIGFLTLYVREAHPGERIPQHESFEDKLALARAYQQRDQISWPVAVDDLDGTLHRQLGRMPDMALLYDRAGRLVYRVLWSNDERGLRKGLRSLTYGVRGSIGRRNAMVVPLLRGMGVTDEVLGRAGRSARRDMLITAPPIYGLARIAGRFRRLSPLQRSLAAIAIVGATIGAGLLVLRSRQKA